MAEALLLGGVTMPDGQTADVHLEGGTIAAVGPPGETAAGTPRRLDLDGYLLLPAPVEPHAHLDKAMTARRVPNPSHDLVGAIDAWFAYRATLEPTEVARRAAAAALQQLANGATAIRTHVDVGPGVGLRAFEGLLEAREALRGQVELQLVPLPTVPVTGLAGADNRAMLRAAMEAGADVVGGCPYLDPDPRASHELFLGLGAEFGRPLDLHSDETLDPDVLNLPDLAELVASTGFGHGVAASHCCSLGVQPVEVARRVAGQLAAAGVGVVCCPQTNLFLQARTYRSAPPRGLTALGPLREAEVLVAAGGDNVQDPFNPMGRGDPLETASLLVTAGHVEPDDAYAAVSATARAILGLPEVRLAPGHPAELLAIRATSVQDAIATSNPERLVVHQGRVVCRTTVTREHLAMDALQPSLTSGARP
jgi:cytosine/creatinine deaminase